MNQILIVDDDPDAREILNLILGTLDISIVQAENGFEALQVVETETPLLIVLDLSMPHLDGEGFLQRLRESSKTSEVPVIVYTAKTLTSEELTRLNVPDQMVTRKGRLSMTHLRDIVIDILRVRMGITFEDL